MIQRDTKIVCQKPDFGRWVPVWAQLKETDGTKIPLIDPGMMPIGHLILSLQNGLQPKTSPTSWF